MDRRIVYTRHDGGVDVVCPSDDAIRWMGCGGYWGNPTRGFLEEQVRRQVAEGRLESMAHAFVHALAYGGRSSREALSIIRDRDCAHRGSGIELWHVEDVPADRWFRDAWRRSHNGGPIDIDLARARQLQWSYIREHAEELGRRHREDLYGEELSSIPLGAIKDRILLARDVTALRTIWPLE